MEEKILFKIYESLEGGVPAAMAVITHENGSIPRNSGSIMAVWKDGRTFGSVGGGKVEYTITEKAVECLICGQDSNFEYKLNEQGTLGMKCGGELKGYIKVFKPKPQLIIIGAGHIGEKLYKLCTVMDYRIVIIDDRKEYGNRERFKEAAEILVGDIGESLQSCNINEHTFITIATQGYDQDKAGLKNSLSKGAAYIGMIGSTKKIRHMMKELMEEGIPKEELQKIYAPMGIDISSNLPEEIALGILSEITLLRNNGTLNHRKSLKKVWD